MGLFLQAMSWQAGEKMIYEIFTKAIPKGRPRFSKYGVYTPARTVKLENEIKNVVRKQRLLNKVNIYTGLVGIALTFDFKRPKKTLLPCPRSDVDNLAKLILDALNGVLYTDDKLVCDLRAVKRWSDSDKITIEINLIE